MPSNIVGCFQRPDTTPFSGATLYIQLVAPDRVVATSTIAPHVVKFVLDSFGCIPAGSKIFQTSELANQTKYTLSLSVDGFPVWSCGAVALNGDPINLSTLTPVLF